MDPAPELGLDTFRSIIYVLPYDSRADSLTSRAQCLAHDPPDPLGPLEIDGILLSRYVFIHGRPRVFIYYAPKEESIKLFHDYLDLHRSNPNLDVQVVLVSVMFGHAPGREKSGANPPLCMSNDVWKFFAVLRLGRDSFVCFSPLVSLRHMADKHGTDKTVAQELVCVTHMHLARQHLAAVDPRLLARQDLFNKLLASRAITKAAEDKARNKKIFREKAQQNAITLMEEIMANLSYKMTRLIDRILGFTWNRLYQGINVHNTERVRQPAHDSHELVYVSRRRSYMDRLLLSYVLYHQGSVPPHIVAEINLNLWPTGPTFRRLGAFSVHHTPKGNKLYSTASRECLDELFSHSYSIEYSVEGDRSRTGRLLDPKTGTPSMTIQAMLRGGTRPIIPISIYINYEHVMKMDTYAKELHGAAREKESLPQMLCGSGKLRNLSQGYVNFGEPMLLMTCLNQYVPDRRGSIDPIEAVHPAWLTPTVNNIVADLMVHISNTGMANAMNLCYTALLTLCQHSLIREQSTEQFSCHLGLMRNVPYSMDSTVSSASASELIDHALQMSKLEVEKGTIGDIIILPHEQVVLMAHYRNSIAHMLVLPSLTAAIVTQHRYISCDVLTEHVNVLYSMLKAELSLHQDRDELPDIIDALTNEMQRQGLITLQDDGLYINPAHSCTLQLLVAGTHETL